MSFSNIYFTFYISRTLFD